MWQLQLYCHMQPRAALELARPPLARTISHSIEFPHSLALAPARQNSFALVRPPLGSHCLKLALTRLPARWLELAHFFSNSLARCCKTTQFSQRCNRTMKFKRRFSGWIKLPVPIFTLASLPGPSYVSPCKISAKSDYPRLSYCDLTNL